MNYIIILTVGILLAIACSSLWFAFQRPSFVAGLVNVAAKAVFAAILPTVLKRKSLEGEAKDHDLAARGRQVGNPRPWGHEKGVDS